MNMTEFKAALAIAKGDVKIDMDKYPLDPFDGFGLQVFHPVLVHIEQVARLMRWQAQMFNGGWDDAALEEIKHFAVTKKRFILKIK